MGQKKLFSKLDWFSGVFQNVSIAELAHEFSVVFDIDFEYVDQHRYLSSSNTGASAADCVLELVPGVQVRVPIDYFNFMQEVNPVDLFDDPKLVLGIDLGSIVDFTFPRIIFNCTGSGLDNLRNLGYNVDENFRLMFPGLLDPAKGKSFHVTRCDFAFDFLNWCPDLPYDFDDFLRQGDRKTGLWYGKNKNPLTTECRLSAKQSTVYIGNSNGSEKILRIYDKKQQYEGNLAANVPLEYCDGSGEDREYPDSWIRIELQARRGVAEKLLTGHDPNTLTSVDMEYWDKRYWAGILKWICEYYSPRLRYGEPIADFWITLFDWSLIDVVIQNAKYVDTKTQLERAESFIWRNSQSLLTVLSHKGIMDFLLYLRDMIELIQKDRRWRLKYSRLCAAETLGVSKMPAFLIPGRDGYLKLKDLDLLIEYCQELRSNGSKES